MSNFAIICEARKGHALGIAILALVDRRIEKKLWWTSDKPKQIMKFKSRETAERQLNRLQYNSPEIVDYDIALKLIREQAEEIEEMEYSLVFGEEL